MRHKSRALKGSVLEVDGATVYLEAENGVEMQFALGDLEDDGPGRAGPAQPPRRFASAGPAGPAAAAAQQVPDPKDTELLSRIPESVLGLAAVRFARDPKTQRNGWSDAGAREKLEWVARVTGLSRDQLATLVRAGKARQIEAHASVANGRPR